MDSEHSNDASGTHGPSTESPTQTYVLPGHQDGLKPESSILNQDGAGSGPNSKSPAQGYVLPNHEGGSKLEPDDADQEDAGSELNAESAAQEHFSPSGQEGQESSVTVTEQRVVDYDNRRAAIPFPRIPVHRPMNTVTDESLYKLRSEGFGKDSSEYTAAAGLPNRQQAQLLGSYRSSKQQHWQGNNMAQASNPPARDSLATNGQTRAGAEARYPTKHSGAAEQNLHQDPRNNAPSTTLYAASPGENVFPPMRRTLPPLPEISVPYRSHDYKPPPLLVTNNNNNSNNSNNSSLPSINQIIDATQADQWGSQQLPPLELDHLHSSVYESRSVNWRPGYGQPPHFHIGPTQPPGPPMKPFDGDIAEDIGQEQWRIVMLERKRRERRERREAEEGRRTGDRSRRI